MECYQVLSHVQLSDQQGCQVSSHHSKYIFFLSFEPFDNSKEGCACANLILSFLSSLIPQLLMGI